VAGYGFIRPFGFFSLPGFGAPTPIHVPRPPNVLAQRSPKTIFSPHSLRGPSYQRKSRPGIPVAATSPNNTKFGDTVVILGAGPARPSVAVGGPATEAGSHTEFFVNFGLKHGRAYKLRSSHASLGATGNIVADGGPP